MTHAPKHIGIILDGNRRFAKRLMLEPWKGHKLGKDKIEHLIDWSHGLGVKELTLYCFSIQNFNRPKFEFNYIMKLFTEAFREAKNNKRLHDNKVKINFIGRTHLLSQEIQNLMKELETDTKDYSGIIVNFAIAYGGREEIIDAIKKLGRDIEDKKIDPRDLDEETFANFLYMKSEPDLIIRTGGDHRTSNFLAWQGTYSEWIFLEKTWPEFEKSDLIECIDNFSKRQRRFGK